MSTDARILRRLMSRRHDSRGRPFNGVLAVLVLIAFAGCSTDPSPFTAASFKVLPPEGTRLVVWGVPQAAVAVAETWLRHRGLVVVDRRKAEPLSCRDDCPEQSVLKLGKAVRADQVVFLRTSTEHEPTRVVASIRSLSAAMGEELWQAVASQRLPAGASEEEISTERVKVVCHALATAWGFRGGGYARDSSLDFCHIKALRP